MHTQGRPATGVKTGVAAGLKSNRRELGGLVLRRDPTAFEKLHMLDVISKMLGADAKASAKNLSICNRRAWEHRFGYPYDTAIKWWDLRTAMQEFLASRRVGVHGVRPFGSTAPLCRSSKSQGARLSKVTDEPISKQPLNKVLLQVKRWFDNERERNHEVRSRHIAQRVKYQIEYERDRQMVLQQVGSPKFNELVLQSCEHKLSFLRVHDPVKRQKDFCPGCGLS